MLTLSSINKKFETLGYKERLRKGYRYFYFSDGDTENWMETSVYVSTLNSLTFEDWINELLRLKSNQVNVQKPEIVDIKKFLLETILAGIEECTENKEVMIPSKDFYNFGEPTSDYICYINAHSFAEYINNKIQNIKETQ